MQSSLYDPDAAFSGDNLMSSFSRPQSAMRTLNVTSRKPTAALPGMTRMMGALRGQPAPAGPPILSPVRTPAGEAAQARLRPQSALARPAIAQSSLPAARPQSAAPSRTPSAEPKSVRINTSDSSTRYFVDTEAVQRARTAVPAYAQLPAQPITSSSGRGKSASETADHTFVQPVAPFTADSLSSSLLMRDSFVQEQRYNSSDSKPRAASAPRARVADHAAVARFLSSPVGPKSPIPRVPFDATASASLPSHLDPWSVPPTKPEIVTARPSANDHTWNMRNAVIPPSPVQQVSNVPSKPFQRPNYSESLSHEGPQTAKLRQFLLQFSGDHNKFFEDITAAVVADTARANQQMDAQPSQPATTEPRDPRLSNSAVFGGSAAPTPPSVGFTTGSVRDFSSVAQQQFRSPSPTFSPTPPSVSINAPTTGSAVQGSSGGFRMPLPTPSSPPPVSSLQHAANAAAKARTFSASPAMQSQDSHYSEPRVDLDSVRAASRPVTGFVPPNMASWADEELKRLGGH
eukprot:TRINITY_DN10827_c0_g1_i1.p1 TRINITY_DN10827_c0_g1~~TRINITY_DN10827_c0_g1_i1.p1  ORF type:complete len:517 (+),score=99.31 TRINITY_DN10827_c0_g1_i1:72-1622(+)